MMPGYANKDALSVREHVQPEASTAIRPHVIGCMIKHDAIVRFRHWFEALFDYSLAHRCLTGSCARPPVFCGTF
jgi:hypothetical protein